MEDKELLMLAAKVADIKPEDGGPVIAYDRGVWIAEDRFWNPLDDDGDAMRLAVKLKLSTVFGVNYVIVDGNQSPTVNNTNDPSLAVRQAIVRAAAEIWLASRTTKEQ